MKPGLIDKWGKKNWGWEHATASQKICIALNLHFGFEWSLTRLKGKNIPYGGKSTFKDNKAGNGMVYSTNDYTLFQRGFLYKGVGCMRVKYQLVGRNYGKYLGKQNKMTL